MQERSFGQTVANLVIDAGFITGTYGPDWPAFVATVPGLNYESLRKAISGERPPSIRIMEAVATALDVPPETFQEYRRIKILEQVQAMNDDELTALSRWLNRR